MRARTLVEKNSDGPIEISEVSSDGRFVALHNKGQDTEQVGGWRLVRDLDRGRLLLSWLLPPRFELSPGQTVKVHRQNTLQHYCLMYMYTCLMYMSVCTMLN